MEDFPSDADETSSAVFLKYEVRENRNEEKGLSHTKNSTVIYSVESCGRKPRGPGNVSKCFVHNGRHCYVLN